MIRNFLTKNKSTVATVGVLIVILICALAGVTLPDLTGLLQGPAGSVVLTP